MPRPYLKTIFQTLSTGLLIMVSLTQSGCTNRELVAGIAGAAIGATAVGIANSAPPAYPQRHDHHHEHGHSYPVYPAPAPPPVTCRNESRRVCRSFTDYWGHLQTSCTDEWYNSCDSHRRMSLGTKTAIPTNLEVANYYDMSFESAQNFLEQLGKASQGDATGLTSLGLSDDDIETLGSFNRLPSESIQRISKALNIPTDRAEMMVDQILAFAKQKATEQAHQENETSI